MGWVSVLLTGTLPTKIGRLPDGNETRPGDAVDWLEAVPLGQVLNGGGWAVAFWAILYVARMVYTGKLVPQKTHEDTVKALEIERTRNELLLKQVERTTDSMEVFEAFVRSLPQGPQGPVRVESRQGEVQRQKPRRVRRGQDWGGWNPPGPREDGE